METKEILIIVLAIIVGACIISGAIVFSAFNNQDNSNASVINNTSNLNNNSSANIPAAHEQVHQNKADSGFYDEWGQHYNSEGICDNPNDQSYGMSYDEVQNYAHNYDMDTETWKN